MVPARPRPRLSALVAGYTGYRIEGAEPGVHRGLPSRHLTFIVTLDGTVDLAAMPDPAQSPASFATLVGGLHATPALISHDGHQHGIQVDLTPLGARVLLGLPAGELASTVVDMGTLLGPVAGELARAGRLHPVAVARRGTPIRPRQRAWQRCILDGMTETPAPTIWPCLTYADAPAAIRFLAEAFGFVETLVVPGEHGREIAHAELRWPEGGGVMLGSTSDESVFGRSKPGMTSNYVVTDQPDALFERATAAGAEVVRGLQDEDYGSRGCTVRDPEGNLWSFGTYPGT